MKKIFVILINLFFLLTFRVINAQCAPPKPILGGNPDGLVNCGPKAFTVNIQANFSGCSSYPTAAQVTFKWYTASTGGTLVGTSTVPSGPAGNPVQGIYTSSFLTPTISSYTIYYVSTVNNNGSTVLESARLPVELKIGTTIPPQPGAFTTSTSTLCSGTSNVIYTVPAVSGTKYAWKYTGLYATDLQYSTSNSISLSFDIAATSGNLEVQAVLDGCKSAARSLPITVNPTPAIPPTVTNSTNGFAPMSITLNASGSPVGTTYEWYSAATGGTLLSSNSTYNVTNINTTTSYYVGTTTTSCKSLTRKPIVLTVYPAPSVTALGSAILFHQNCSLNLTANSNYTRYEWLNSSGNVIATTKDIAVNKADEYRLKVYVGTPEITATSTAFSIYNQYNTSSLPLNYVVSRTVKKSGIKTVCDINGLGVNDVNTSIEYIDGIGRSIQQVQLQASPTQKDLVKPIDYDVFGRITKDYLPYATSTGDGAFKTNYIADQAAFYNNSLNNNEDKIPNTSYPYVKKEYDASPLDILTKTYAPGASYQSGSGKSVNTNRRPNIANEVKKWIYDHSTGNASGSNFYSAGSLWVEEITNEEGLQSITYKDFNNNIVLTKKLNGTNFTETYYVFDDFGKLRYVVPPTYSLTTITAGSVDEKNYLFSYKYDARLRLIQKNVPGAGVTYYVYNRQDLPVLSQDENQRTTNKWGFVKYDVHKRAIISGIYTHSASVTQAAMQTLVDAVSTTYEKKQNYTTNGYSSSAFPTVNYEELTVNYYDSYDFDNNGTIDYTYVPQGMANEAVPSAMVNALPVGTKNKILGTTNNWLVEVRFYDPEKRIVQTQRNNQMNLGAMSDIETVVYNFAGIAVETKQIHNPGTGNVTINQRLEYDHMNRPKKVWHKVNNNPEVLLSQKKYNEIGVMIEKNLHSENLGSTFLQSVDYTYDIGGKLTHINNINLVEGMTGTNGSSNNDDNNDLFAYKLDYELSHYMHPGRYDGQIAAMYWRMSTAASTTNKLRSYKYTYDYLGRLSDAYYGTFETGPYYSFSNKYNESLTYDNNGNITTLKRYNKDATLIDDLTYTYSGNRLSKIKDLANTTLGFIDNVDIASEYTYDNNGNITADLNKSVSSISYNHLNLINQVINGTTKTQFTFNANGTKLTKTYYPSTASSNVGSTTQYINSSAIYTIAGTGCTSNCTSFILIHEEGRVKPEGTGFKYEYDLRDHLNNVHVTFDKNPSTGLARIIQEDHYYPFGMKLDGLSYDFSSGNKFLYSNKELQIEIGDLYHFDARFYDPVIARFTTIDPLTEELEQNDKSPYAYAWNNPIKYNDPDGKCPSCVGAIVGALVETTSQVVGNRLNGDSWDEAFSKIDYGDVAIAAGEGFLTSGASAVKGLGHVVVVGGAELIKNKVDLKKDEIKFNDTKSVIRNTAFGLTSTLLSKAIPEMKLFSPLKQIEVQKMVKLFRETGKLTTEGREKLIKIFKDANLKAKEINKILNGTPTNIKVGIITEVVKNKGNKKNGD